MLVYFRHLVKLKITLLLKDQAYKKEKRFNPNNVKVN